MLIEIFILGAGILGVALVLNYLAAKLGLSTWYDYVHEHKANFSSYVWLFVVYPFCLGLTAHVLLKIIG